MTGRELRTARKEKAVRKFAALADPVAPSVEMDDEFFRRDDLAYARSREDGSLERARDHRALEAQVQREGTAI